MKQKVGGVYNKIRKDTTENLSRKIYVFDLLSVIYTLRDKF